MKNDLTVFERGLLRQINMQNNTYFNYKNLMEWDTNEQTIKNNLQQGEKIYKVRNFYIVIKE